MLPQANSHLCAAPRKPYSIIDVFGIPIRLCYNRRVPTRRNLDSGHSVGVFMSVVGDGVVLILGNHVGWRKCFMPGNVSGKQQGGIF